MRKTALIAAGLLLVAAPFTPALAGWGLAAHGSSVKVAKSNLTVTPGEDWNRWSRRPIRKSEIWTLDGQGLNQLYFVSGLAAGETLYRDMHKRDRPLPKMGAAMQLTEIPEFFESSNRVALNTSVFRTTGVEPAQFGGHPGVRFTFEYAVDGSALVHKGVAIGTLAGDKLYLISFIAPSVFYFDRDRAEAEAIMASASF